MINGLIDGISQRLRENFGAEYEIYTEPVKQGLKKPCFFILPSGLTVKPLMKERSFWEHRFCIKYYPAGDDARAENVLTQQRLAQALGYITWAEGITRGVNMQGEIKDNILHFYVNYNLVAREAAETEPMEKLTIV